MTDWIVKHLPGPQCIIRLHQNPWNHDPAPLSLPHVLLELFPVSVIGIYGASQIREDKHWLKGVHIDIGVYLDRFKELL